MSTANSTIPAEVMDNLPNKKSSAQQWESFWNLLEKRYGNTGQMQSVFLKAWNSRHSSDANTSDLRAFFKKKGLTIEGDSILSGSVDFVHGYIGGLASIFGVGKWVFLGIFLLIFAPVIMALFNIAKNPIGAANAAAKFTPGGAAA